MDYVRLVGSVTQPRDTCRNATDATKARRASSDRKSALFWLAVVVIVTALLFPSATEAQRCTGNPTVGCVHPGAACRIDSGDSTRIPSGQTGHCKTPPGFPRGERSCECVVSSTPPVTLNPKYLVLGLVYAPPGCSNTAANQCGNASSLVDYAGGSSLGSKVTTKNSFKGEHKVSVDIAKAWGFDAGFSVTDADGTSAAITKSASLDIKALGNGDGIDHGQDQFILLLNPTVTLRQQDVNLYWSPGYEGPFLTRSEVYVSELRRPSTMRPGVSAELKRLGFTTDDYQHILSLDPYGGTVCTGGRFSEISTCNPQVATEGSGGIALDSRRFAPTAWSFPYEPPLESASCNNGVCNCTIFSGTLKNETVGEASSESTTEYTVGLHADAPLSDVFGLKASGQLTWTSTSTSTNTTDSSQSATATISCPSSNYTGPQHIAIYWDKLWGSFLFVPYDVSAAIVHQGKVINASGKPVRGQLVHLTYGGKTYHTVTGRNGTYEFFAARRTTGLSTARLIVGNVQKTVNLGATEPTIISLRSP